MVAVNQPSPRMLRIDEVQIKIGLSRSAIYSRLDPKSQHYDASFPLRVSLGSRAVAFVEYEIECWLNSRINVRGGK